MKPFNLKEALTGKPIQTRDGHNVTLLPNFRTGLHTYTIAAIIHRENKDVICCYTPNGSCYSRRRKHPDDLFMTSESKVRRALSHFCNLCFGD